MSFVLTLISYYEFVSNVLVKFFLYLLILMLLSDVT